VIADVAAMDELSLFLVHTPLAILFIIIKFVQVIVVFKVDGLCDHVSPVFLGGGDARDIVEQVELFRKVLGLRYVGGIRKQERRFKLGVFITA